MQISKKIYSTLIISLLTLSMFAIVVPMASAEIVGNPVLVHPTALTPLTTGPVGTQVRVVGEAGGAGGASPFATVKVYLGAPLYGIILGTGAADATGNYSIVVTIPPTTAGVHDIVVNDGETESGSAQFTVTPRLKVATVPPSFGMPRVLPGDSLSLTGDGYAPNDDIVVTLNSTVISPANNLVLGATISTNVNGSFTAVVVVPAVAAANYSIYNVTAIDEASNNATAQININYYLIVNPPSGPTGITISMTGRIPASTAYELRFNTATVATGTSAADGAFSGTYQIPSVLSTGPYDVHVVWTPTDNRTAQFTISPAPTIVIGPPTSATAGTEIAITGAGFSGGASITLMFGTTVVNSTALDSRFGPVTATGPNAGKFTESFTVPALAPGVYAVSVTDSFGASTQPIYSFVILATPVTTIVLNGAAYEQGDWLSFSFYTTETSLGTITVTINDPAGITWWTTAAWTLTGTTVKRMPYMNQVVNNNPIVLPADAPIGAWNWTVAYTPASTGLATKATAIFTVSAPASLAGIMTKLDQVQANITDAITTSQGVIITNLNGLDAKLTSITSSIASISTTVGTINTAVSNLNIGTLGSDVMEIAGDVATIQTSLGSLTADLDAIGLEVTDISGTVATIETDLGTLSGTVTSIDDGVATIETEVGTVKADVQGLSEVDMTPVWIAVVLSLVAAIAAVFAVITIRSKIAG